MTVMVRKTNHDYWVRFKEFDTAEDLFQHVLNCHHPIILNRNLHYGDDPEELLQYWEDITLETAEKICSCYFEIEIYNDYREQEGWGTPHFPPGRQPATV